MDPATAIFAAGKIVAVLRAAQELGARAKSALERKALLASPEDKKVLLKLVAQLQERRVFHAPFNDEVVNACVYSVGEVRKLAYETLGSIENVPAKLFVQNLLEDCRSFIDVWQNSSLYPVVRGWRPDRWSGEAGLGDDGRSLGDFHQSLGALRERVSQNQEALQHIIDDTLLSL